MPLTLTHSLTHSLLRLIVVVHSDAPVMLIQSMLSDDPDERPTATQALETASRIVMQLFKKQELASVAGGPKSAVQASELVQPDRG